MSSYMEIISDKINDFDSHKVFFANDFLDIASNATVRQILKRLADEDKIKRVIDGFYYNPKYSELIGEYEAVSIHELALAIARKYNWNIAPYSSTALNLLGLSTQVPTHYKYISSGRYKEYKIGDTVLEFKKVNPGEIANMSLKTATVIQAIKSLGKEDITREVIQKIRENLTEKERIDLTNESKSVPAWVYEVIREICEGKNE
ncbi:TPA: hypothetical protein VA365_002341 [Streptococcus agalactiae]|uniref:DUF6088 family protein n=1 Tax=Streptococcus TaxID=1301 RepID=UPI000763F8EF|nr:MULTISPECIES: DUF6088 family protein [Streptococcus]HER9274129.1 hypothetical protein [Streptococcus pyogenes]OCX00603.1 hypothetical protein BBG10_08975 [Streptococcus dysgalactiae subsp. equisimilis]OHR15003.1 hypothetical protein HMPREF2707_02480 [Streptococcus sp. HMSC078E03]HEN2719994.1 hypothetical protein [Streptococcus agalactiae]HEN2721101.1 hypothetical protein [Streptococcus agalactiae]